MTKNYSGAAADGLMNLNGHVLCSIDFETTGLTAGYHDAIEVAIVPVGADLRPSKKVAPFTCLLRPKDRYPDSWTEGAYNVHKISREELMIHGQEPFKAADRFVDWVQKLGLGPYKKIAPLAYNWPLDRGFLHDWLCPQTFEMWIWHRYRDSMPLVLALNDRAEQDGRDCPFPQTGLQDVRARLNIPECAAHRALGDALVHIEVYRELMTGNWFKGEQR